MSDTPRVSPLNSAGTDALRRFADAVLDARDGFRDDVKLCTERAEALATDPIRAALCRGQAMAYEEAAGHIDDRGLWTGEISCRDPQTSKRVYRKASARTKTEARAKLVVLKHDMAKAGTAASGAMTVAMVTENLMSNLPASWVSPQTVNVNRIHADKITAALGKIRVTELTPQQVETRLLAPMVGKGHAKTTVIRTRGISRMALKKAMRDQGLGRNVAELAEIPGYGDKPSARKAAA